MKSGQQQEISLIEIFPETILLFKVDHFEGFLNWCKIDGMVNDT